MILSLFRILLMVILFLSCSSESENSELVVKSPVGGSNSVIEDSVSESPDLEPDPIVVNVVLLNLSQPRLLVGEATNFTANGVFSDGSYSSLLDTANISVGDQSILSISGGEVTGASEGVTFLRVEQDGVSSTVLVEVFQASLVSISLNSGNLTLSSDGSYQYELTAVYDNGVSANVTHEAEWTIDDPTIADIDYLGVKGRVSSLLAGTATIQASFEGQSVIGNLTVESTAVSSIEITPVIGRGVVGEVQEFTATAILNDNTTQDISSIVSWVSSDSTKLSFSGSTATLTAAGTIDVSISFAGLEKTVTFVVESKTLQSIEISNVLSSYPIGVSSSLVAIANYSDGSSSDITDTVSWSSSNTEVFGVNSNAEIVPVAQGSGIVSISYLGQSASENVVITNATLSSISVLPSESFVSSGIDMRLTAEGTYSDGSTADITSLVTWSSSDENLALMSNNEDRRGYLENVYTGSSTQTVVITASLEGVSNTASVIIAPGTIVSIETNLGSLTMNPFTEKTIKAFAKFSDGASVDISDLVVWSSSDNVVALISNGLSTYGTITALENGSSEIVASYKTFTSSDVTLTVSDSEEASGEELGTGLMASYFSGNSFNTLAGQRIDSQIDFNWDRGAAPLGIGDYFSVQWRGKIKGKMTGACTIASRSDDGFRVTIGESTLIEVWFPHAPRWDYAYNVNFEEGIKQDISVDFYENGGHAVAELYWQCPGDAELVPIPTEYLFPE